MGDILIKKKTYPDSHNHAFIKAKELFGYHSPTDSGKIIKKMDFEKIESYDFYLANGTYLHSVKYYMEFTGDDLFTGNSDFWKLVKVENFSM